MKKKRKKKKKETERERTKQENRLANRAPHNRGERAADQLERELNVFEAKLEELLLSMGMTDADLDELDNAGGGGDAAATDTDGCSAPPGKE